MKWNWLERILSNAFSNSFSLQRENTEYYFEDNKERTSSSDLLFIQVFCVTHVVTAIMWWKISVKLLKNSSVSNCTGRDKDKIKWWDAIFYKTFYKKSPKYHLQETVIWSSWIGEAFSKRHFEGHWILVFAHSGSEWWDSIHFLKTVDFKNFYRSAFF